MDVKNNYMHNLTWKILFSPLFLMYSLGKNSFKLGETDRKQELTVLF